MELRSEVVEIRSEVLELRYEVLKLKSGGLELRAEVLDAPDLKSIGFVSISLPQGFTS